MKKILTFLLAVLAVRAVMIGGDGLYALAALAGLIGFLYVIGRVVLSLFGFGRGSGGKAGRGAYRRANDARRRMSRGMAGTIMGGLNSVFYPKKPSAADLKKREYERLKDDRAFHDYQAKKYAGSRDGAWHAGRAEDDRQKLKHWRW